MAKNPDRLHPITTNAWGGLKRFTPARIALGRAGAGLPTAAHLAFQRDHALARDAVHAAMDIDALATALAGLGEITTLTSAAPDRATYLARPDLGRRLDPASRSRLEARESNGERPDIALIVADGLSAKAAERHAAPLLAAALPDLKAGGLSIGPLALVSMGRVAIGDEIGEILGARMACMLIGERPGLSSPDSLGVYLTYAPSPGRNDAERNCISNIRPEGLAYSAAAQKLCYLATEALRRGETGVMLKDEQAASKPDAVETRGNFLVPGPDG